MPQFTIKREIGHWKIEFDIIPGPEQEVNTVKPQLPGLFRS